MATRRARTVPNRRAPLLWFRNRSAAAARARGYPRKSFATYGPSRAYPSFS